MSFCYSASTRQLFENTKNNLYPEKSDSFHTFYQDPKPQLFIIVDAPYLIISR